MGDLIWHHWARLVSISASIYLIWAGFWGIFFRKFFWDFVGGVRMNTETQKGIIPGPNAAPFIAIIVTVPAVQIVAMISGILMLLMDYPAPFMKKLGIYRSLSIRVVLLLHQTFVASLFYQGTNAAIWSLIAALAYTRGVMKGEVMEEAQENRGKTGTV